MRRLGVSIYPENASVEQNKSYLYLAAKYGFTRVFTCLISAKGDIDKIIRDFKEVVTYAKSLGMEVIADVSPEVFKRFNISFKNLKFFYELNLAGIRLDIGFSGIEESLMTFNEHKLKIEINISNGTKYLDNILTYLPNKENLIGCHNFYPHRYTGLSREHFIKCSKQFKEYGIRTAAFISSSNATFGPWHVNEGLCTLEEHRNKPIEVQAKDLFNTDLIDDVIIANCFASEEELKILGNLDRNILELTVEFNDNVPELEKKIVLEELHFNRGDVSEYMIRSTQSRIKYKGHKFELFNPKPIKRGDILIESSLYDRYAGELQIALKDMENSGKTNVVGKIVDEELFLIDYIKPWQKFKFKKAMH
ncbi:hypothetical protein SAMN02745883_00487 [Caminicella sporogenes DSM 14501]|uniref:Outer surface protein n=1 Tax=Caminicella sporogenes DSM 14501 TaxID=1121266 RepID=A0A1M6MDB2_9FIRM|nr:DUF871 domain-containing protein [Caminicella sporogenes]RKD27604.1 outer surface protein [Caminicella sporogenes]SHJ81253.1 hypothetical protein SAMN02745883_00487 [Caminicella sporogenes DSM 14501]